MPKNLSLLSKINTAKLHIYVPVSLLLVGMSCVGLAVGWYAGTHQAVQSATPRSTTAIRVPGYQYTNPLLLSDNGAGADTPSFSKLGTELRSLSEKAKSEGAITSDSIYLRELKTGSQLNINGSEQYFPGSLTKVPLLMSYLKESETNSDILTRQINYDVTQDFNLGAEIPPRVKPQLGQTYSVDDLLGMMIKNSDNDSFNVLMTADAQSQLKELFKDMQVYYFFDQPNLSDVITASQFSLFLRTLYNSTYLRADLSEKALELMSQSEYANGLVGGLPREVSIAHKFGIWTQLDAQGKFAQRQLHDCGIVYAPNHVYDLCVMTKGKSSLDKTEKFIQDISAAVYAASQRDFK